MVFLSGHLFKVGRLLILSNIPSKMPIQDKKAIRDE